MHMQQTSPIVSSIQQCSKKDHCASHIYGLLLCESRHSLHGRTNKTPNIQINPQECVSLFNGPKFMAALYQPIPKRRTQTMEPAWKIWRTLSHKRKTNEVARETNSRNCCSILLVGIWPRICLHHTYKGQLQQETRGFERMLTAYPGLLGKSHLIPMRDGSYTNSIMFGTNGGPRACGETQFKSIARQQRNPGRSQKLQHEPSLNNCRGYIIS